MSKQLAIALGVAFVAAATASAEPASVIERRAAPANAISLHALSLGTRGLAIEGERHVRERFSAVVGLAGRAPAGGDYISRSVTASSELRWWIKGDAPWASYAGRAMVGPYVGFRVDAGYTWTGSGGVGIGSTMIVGESVTSGYRFAFWHRLEVTPSVSLGFRHELDLEGRLAPWTRGSLGLALKVGVLF